MLISCSSDESAAIWQVSSGNCDKSWQGQGLTNWVNAIAFSRDGTRLAVGSNDHTVKFWQHDEARNIDIFKSFRRPAGQVWSVAFSPDGYLLASGYDDGTLIILDVQTGTPYQILRSDRPYERLNIRGVKGLTTAQKRSLKALGAIEEA
jgi:WD40 repeat protein